MDQTDTNAELRVRVAEYRALARLTTDQEIAQRIHELANELAARIREIASVDRRFVAGPE
ncbi:hypothetical protein FNL55_23920 [Tardiphaga sp. vice352]|uniref:hypothetical protein n=1 Tax=unclassified Tardiphaga TaxID=2631404 RepID=UPI0011650E13|nr:MULTISPECIES: hypothetical protein [unclassified Tardiphaga]MBC7586276.1 hypothetical protein [Tardiphaga sp.]QDM18744.1 hypothetical protein FNL53_24450 [Tardiphaga sp. vice278]QDM23740.1 hypothetical protein FIU28_23230 [Tardiphaga sp. vice154]QDM28963.1 hypothetical protein FNL56_24670 [Tardiphaga sp. vice304]QDM34062.1 hypothetical protein FNL55_23920 [Tardiphaga sp. vice352]